MATTDYPTSRRMVSGWAVGFAVFAGAIMLMVGTFQIITGLAAIFEDQFYVVSRNYVFDLDVTAFGWIHLLLGVVLVLAGWGIFSGATWARAVGMTLAILSAIANFFFIPYYPVWSIVIIALDVLVIWALTVWTREQATAAKV
jgi:hypothetical protein